MAITLTSESYSADFVQLGGRATANADTMTFKWSRPMRTWTIIGSRPTTGNLSFTVDAAIDNTLSANVATCTVATGTVNLTSVVDKPFNQCTVTFTDVGSTTVTFGIIGVP